MYFILFALWIIFNGQWTSEIAITGAVVCALVYLFSCKYIGIGPKQEWRFVKRLPKAIAYGCTLIVEILKANIQTLRFIYSPRLEVEPELHTFRTKLKSTPGRVMLANSITLTPGTITVHLKDDLYVVHCLDSSMGDGLKDSDFEKKLLEMEAM